MATTLLATPAALEAALGPQVFGPAIFLAVLLGLDLVTDYWP